jgi:hypothetical protein
VAVNTTFHGIYCTAVWDKTSFHPLASSCSFFQKARKKSTSALSIQRPTMAHFPVLLGVLFIQGVYGLSGKRGIAYNNNNPSRNAVYANLFKGNSKVSWGYDWGYPSWNLDASFELSVKLWRGVSRY